MKDIEQKLDALRTDLRHQKATVSITENRINILTAYKALVRTGLSFGYRFRLKGEAFKQDAPEGVITGHKDGRLIGRLFRTDGKMSGNEVTFYPHRLAQVVNLGPDPTYFDKYNNGFDPSSLLVDEEQDDL